MYYNFAISVNELHLRQNTDAMGINGAFVLKGNNKGESV